MLVATRQSSARIGLKRSNRRALMPKSSNTASITRSELAKSSSAPPTEIRPAAASASSGRIRPLSTLRV